MKTYINISCLKFCSSYEKLHNKMFISKKFLSITDILTSLLIFVSKRFLKNFTLPKNLSNS